MEKIVKKVVREEKEVVAVQITKDEFVELAAKECTNLAVTLMSEGEPSELDILMPMVCAKYSANLAARIFGDEITESEEKDNA